MQRRQVHARSCTLPASVMESISIANAQHYTWPSAISEHTCDGWHLHRSASLSVIEERMPPGSAERRHLHEHATQFFYVLVGELTIELNGEEHRLTPLHRTLYIGPDAASGLQSRRRGRALPRHLQPAQPRGSGSRRNEWLLKPLRASIEELPSSWRCSCPPNVR